MTMKVRSTWIHDFALANNVWSLVLQDRLDDLNDDLVNQKMLTKKKIEVIKRSGEQLRAEKAKNDGLQKGK